jgi:hypothetical protein
MIRVFILLFIFGIFLYAVWAWGRGGILQQSSEVKGSPRFRSKRDPSEMWLQVYETDSLDEAKTLRAKLQEQEVECVLYEQGKKDIQGNALKAIGIATPKSSSRLAQNVISRTPA